MAGNTQKPMSVDELVTEWVAHPDARARIRGELSRLRAERAEVRAEVERLRPVAEAAERWRRSPVRGSRRSAARNRLHAALDALSRAHGEPTETEENR